MKKRWFVLAVFFILIALAIGTWYLFFKAEKCSDLECFQKNLADCSKASYKNEGEWTYTYKIDGEKEGKCIVDAKLIFAGLEPKFNSLIGKGMKCSMPIRMIDFPENNLDYCTGPLKESIQYLVIKDLYQYAAENLGKWER